MVQQESKTQNNYKVSATKIQNSKTAVEIEHQFLPDSKTAVHSVYLNLGSCSLRKDRISFYQVEKDRIFLVIGGAKVTFVKDISFIPTGILLSEIEFINLKEFVKTLK